MYIQMRFTKRVPKKSSLVIYSGLTNSRITLLKIRYLLREDKEGQKILAWRYQSSYADWYMKRAALDRREWLRLQGIVFMVMWWMVKNGFQIKNNLITYKYVKIKGWKALAKTFIWNVCMDVKVGLFLENIEFFLPSKCRFWEG